MYKVKDNVWLGIKFGDKDYPIDILGFKSVTVTENNRLFVPFAILVFADSAQWFENNVMLKDGMPVEISIGQSQEDSTTYKFRVFRYTREVGSGTSVYSVSCLLDAPVYLIDSSSKGFYGTSSAALKDLAARSKLTAAMEETVDLQWWSCGNERNCCWAADVAKHGYSAPDSLMQLCVTLDRRMIYRNVNAPSVYSGSPKIQFTRRTTVQKGVYQIADARVLSSAGFANARGGYAFALSTQPLNQYQDSVSQLRARKITNSLDMNQDVKEGLDSGRIRFAPIDCGNVHKNYEKAAYQNERGALVWSNGIQILVQSVTQGSLLDLALVEDNEHGNSKDTSTKSQSGKYLVTAKAIHIDGSNYYEKYELWTTGKNI